MADLTDADVKEMRGFLAGACTDLKRWLPEPEWHPGWQSEAATERANHERGPAGPWGEDPVRGVYTAAALYLEAVLQCMRALAASLTTETTHYVPYCLARAAMEAGSQAHWLLEPGIGARRRVARFMLLRASGARHLAEEARKTGSAAAASNGETTPDGLTALAFNSPVLGQSVVESPTSPNVREVRAAGLAAVGGIGSARGLAKAYATAIGAGGAPALLDSGTIAQVTQQQVCGLDRVLNKVMCFGIVFMKPHQEVEFGSYRAFGHDGAGGGLAFADPVHGIGFGYIPMPIQYPGAADPKGVQLSTLVRSCIRLRS
jgi:hypothetical protein